MMAEMGIISISMVTSGRNLKSTLGHNVIHGDLKVNVSVINGRPTRVFNFKLTSTNLALRICKFEGGPRLVTYLGEKVDSWPKDLSCGPKDLNKTRGFVQAQPMATVNPIGENLPIKPR